MSTQNICSCGEERKMLCGYLLFSEAMVFLLKLEVKDNSQKSIFHGVCLSFN